MNRKTVVLIDENNYYCVTFFQNNEPAHTRKYITSAGALMDVKDWLTHGVEPTAQEELEELAI